MNRWLSLQDVGIELRLSERSVRKLLRSGRLVGYQLPRQGRKPGKWRVLDPGEKFARYLHESQFHIEHIPLASSEEFAEILGVRSATIRQWKKRGKIHGRKMGNRTVYSAIEIRRALFWRNLDSRGKYSPILVRWIEGIIKRDFWIGGDILDNLLRQALPLPEPQKSRCTVQLWSLFDRINRILKYAREFQHRMPAWISSI
jgi:MerR HTH family regulatory protein